MKNLINTLNKRVKDLDVFDIGLTKWAALTFGILLVKLFPQLLGLSYLSLVVAILVFSIRPLIRFFK